MALERDLELVQWLDYLGYDEAWIGEHHSGGWEIIGSPEIFIAVAAGRTRQIKLGTGVVSLPYHHPFMVATRMVQLDHLTRGRVILGVGSGAFVADMNMIGVDPNKARQMMDESLEVIIRLFTETEPITYKSDWFELRDAMLQLRPYQRPFMPLAVASVVSPSGAALAGKHGAAVLNISAPKDLKALWAVAEESAAEHGKTVKREDWRITYPVHLAESRKEALDDARLNAGRLFREYYEPIVGLPPVSDGPIEKIIDKLVDAGQVIVGTPDDCIEAINRIGEESGGFGGFLVFAHEWVTREKTLHSYELLTRYVMPRFQGALDGPTMSFDWIREHMKGFADMRTHAIDRAQHAWEERKR